MDNFTEHLNEEQKKKYEEMMLKVNQTKESYSNFKKKYQGVKNKIRAIQKELIAYGQRPPKEHDYTARLISSEIKSIENKYPAIEKCVKEYKQYEKEVNVLLKNLMKSAGRLDETVVNIESKLRNQKQPINGALDCIRITERYFKNIDNYLPSKVEKRNEEFRKRMELNDIARATRIAEEKKIINPMPWLQRVFVFDYPLGLLPAQLERLRSTVPLLDAVTHLLTDADVMKQTQDKWSIRQHIGHLADLEDLHLGRLDDFAEGKTELRPADMTNQKTNATNHNYHSTMSLIHEFSDKRRKLVSRLEAMDEQQLQFKSLHPRLQQYISPVDMAYFVAEHDAHHLATIRGIIRRLA